MKALVKHIALPATQLPPTREYHEEFKIPESWEAQRAAKKKIEEEKRKKHLDIEADPNEPENYEEDEKSSGGEG